MKITQIMVGEKTGGVERIAPDMSLSLAEAGHRIQLVLHKNFQLPETHQHENIEIVRVPLRHRRDLLSRWYLRRALKTFRPDVAHLHLRQGVTLGNKLCRHMKIPTVTSMHNYGNPDAYDKVDKILVPTRSLGDFLQQHGVHNDKIEFIANFSRLPQAPVAVKLPDKLRFFAFGRL